MTDEALAVLLEIRDELRALRELAEAGRESVGTLRHADRAALRRILPVLTAHFEGRFGTWELIDAAARGDATAANLRLVIGRQSAQRLGKLFAKAAGHDIDGLTLRRCGQDANGALWECVGN